MSFGKLEWKLNKIPPYAKLGRSRFYKDAPFPAHTNHYTGKCGFYSSWLCSKITHNKEKQNEPN